MERAGRAPAAARDEEQGGRQRDNDDEGRGVPHAAWWDFRAARDKEHAHRGGAQNRSSLHTESI